MVHRIASVVGLMSEWMKDGKLMKGTDKDLGGTMRLGSYEARLKKDTKISKFIILLKLKKDIVIDMKLILIIKKILKTKE